MINKKYNIVIIGGGLSGVVAANELSGKGLSICIIDENNYIGGQLLRKIPDTLGKNNKYKPDSFKKKGLGFVDNLQNMKDIEKYINSFLVGIYPENELLIEIENKEYLSIKYDVLLFATGAREKYLPFKGWTLPGVYSGGFLQVMMKSTGILPSKKILLGGTGLFLFAVGYEILKNKGKVLGIHEQSGMINKLKMLPLFADQFTKFAEGGKFLARIYLSGVPVKYNSKIIEARGKDTLDEVVIGKVNNSGDIISGSEKIIKTDTLGLSYGFTPNIEGLGLAGCKLIDKPELGGWITEVDDTLQTNIENIYAAGEITGVGGGPKSICEGKLASLTILKKFEKIDSELYDKKFKQLIKERKKHLKFAKLFNSLYPITKNDILHIPDETVICRCEDVTMGKINKAISSGFNTFDSIKLGTRATMGNCQGRTCSRTINDLISIKKGVSNLEHLSFRPPLKPVSLSVFSEE